MPSTTLFSTCSNPIPAEHCALPLSGMFHLPSSHGCLLPVLQVSAQMSFVQRDLPWSSLSAPVPGPLSSTAIFYCIHSTHPLSPPKSLPTLSLLSLIILPTNPNEVVNPLSHFHQILLPKPVSFSQHHSYFILANFNMCADHTSSSWPLGWFHERLSCPSLSHSTFPPSVPSLVSFSPLLSQFPFLRWSLQVFFACILKSSALIMCHIHVAKPLC